MVNKTKVELVFSFREFLSYFNKFRNFPILLRMHNVVKYETEPKKIKLQENKS